MKDLTVTKYLKVKPSLTHEEFVSLIESNEPIHGFIGWVEIGKSTLDTKLYDYMPNAHNTFIDGEGNESEINKTWREYVSGYVKDSINEGKVIIPLGERTKNGNRFTPVTDSELRAWVRKFGVDKIKTKSEGKALIKITVEDIL